MRDSEVFADARGGGGAVSDGYVGEGGLGCGYGENDDQGDTRQNAVPRVRFPPDTATWEEEDDIPCGEVDFVGQYEAALDEEEEDDEEEE